MPRAACAAGACGARRRSCRHSTRGARAGAARGAGVGRASCSTAPRRTALSGDRRMPYQPIENYGVIGNMRTAALVGLDGSLDWLCLPRFDSPSVFGALLDDRKGGFFRIAPTAEGVRHKQYYWPDTNVLVTRFLHPDGVAEVEDYMPVGPGAPPADQLVRRARVVRGRLPFSLECRPAFDYARARHETRVSEHGARFDAPDLSLGLASSVPLRPDGAGAVGSFTLGEGESATFILRVLDRDAPQGRCPGTGEAEERFRETVGFWQRWLAQCTYQGRWREAVHRSALALKLLTYEPTGAIVAAPTTGMPEGVGGTRNWDYRYCWLRDAAFTVYAFLRIGFTGEAARFMDWLAARWKEHESHCGAPLQLMYAVDGRSDLTEYELPHLDGYMGSKPVRVGNGAHGQLQLDVFGELMDAVYLHNKYARPVSYDAWVSLRGLVDWVADNWDRPDEGVWETRGARKDHVYSRFMCWVALDRGLRLADKRSLPANRAKWLAARDAVYEQVMAKGWSERRRSFVQAYGADNLDASVLLMPLTFFMAPDDPRMLATVDAIRAPVGRGGLAADGLVYRYDYRATHDGLDGAEGTFNMCSFWLVEALTRAGRTDPARLAEARLRFEQMLGYGSPLGLFAEQTGTSGEALGNFPQGFTHLALISAAFNLDRALDGR
ncbi:glycoside hydrolase family 15 protein [Gemmata sp. JC673]|uniref:Glycoside hydrolase family 15 protein n=1 Tax=Gemmata algarum TaxID=2975278 RepID=A0ABU5F7E7_9BACT|nr:glycoside hydrolase family 15 protein [Gemmata algarum]MDY3563048.1 glycoside hydrolase family 15 protein [Gemmata algarum]